MGLLSRALDSKWCWNLAALVCTAEKQNFRMNKALYLLLFPSAKEQSNCLDTAKMWEVCCFDRKTRVHNSFSIFHQTAVPKGKKACHPSLKTPVHFFPHSIPNPPHDYIKFYIILQDCMTLGLLMTWI